MSDTIKLGNSEISSFKVGSSDCKIYLGSTLLYPSEPPTPPTLQWVTFNSGDDISGLDIYGIKGNAQTMAGVYILLANNTGIKAEWDRNNVNIEISSCYSEIVARTDDVEYIFSNIGCSDYFTVAANQTANSTFQLYIYTTPPPTPSYKWIATYLSGTSSAECDASSAITRYEISSTGLQAVEIGDCVTTISSNTFYEYTSMTSVTIGNNVTTIGGYAFNKCSGLTSVTIPNSVTSIGMDAFENCNGLSSVTIPNSVATINEYAFYSCKNLKNVTIGTGVTRIGNYAFRYSTGLTSIIIEATTPPTLGIGVFDYTNDCYIRVPNNSVNTYKSAWSSYANRIISIDTQYIQLQGIQRKAGNLGWVDLGLTVGTDFKIEMSLQYNTAAGGRFIAVDNTFRWFMATQSGTLKSFFDYNGQRISVAAGSAYPLNTDYTITLTNYTMKSSLDSTTTTGATQTSYTPSGNLGIFSTNISGNGDLGIVYSVKVYTNDGATLVGDFIPVKRISDNMITLYNTVTDTFCTATGALAAVT